MQKTTSRKTGLTHSDVLRLQNDFGPNEIKEEKITPVWMIFLSQFTSPLVIILIFACVLSAILGEWIEAAAIGGILFLNAAVSFFQEYRAETAVLALKKMTSPKAHVIRDGQHQIIPAREIVPGDLLVLEAGDLVAADAQIIESSHLETNEAVLTGESLPVLKEKSNSNDNPEKISLAEQKSSVFMGTTVTGGTGIACVTGTGMKTELGKIAHLITTAENTLTPLQTQLHQLGKMLLFLCLMIAALVAGLGFFQGRVWSEILVFSVSLAVAAVPEGMPAVVTVALALGVNRMAARKALVRKLPSVETLGSVSVICTDKTGTLTTGKMRVREVYPAEQKASILRTAAACCDAQLSSDSKTEIGDPTEIAILLAAQEQGIFADQIESQTPRISTLPFDSVRKRMAVFRSDQKLYVKGAPESILSLCSLSDSDLQATKSELNQMTRQGRRVLAVAHGPQENEKDLVFEGLIGIADPPRADVAEAIAEARGAGIIPVMITGDHPDTARAIAQELKLVLDEDNIQERVHARATPEDKLKLIREWKSKSAIVAMTGDGVNDAPALREAHIGIAMGVNGTEVTRQAADLILADDNFSTIIAAVREGRTVYQNIQKSIAFLLTGNSAELMVVLGASFLGLPLPFLAVHLLWINLVTDSLPGLALIADPVTPEIMKNPPRSSQAPLIGKREWLEILLRAGIEATIILALFFFSLQHADVETARNLAFFAIVSSQLFRATSARSRQLNLFQVGLLSNKWLLLVIFFTFFLQLSLHYIPFFQKILLLRPLSFAEIGLATGLALVTTSLIEIKKMILLRRP